MINKLRLIFRLFFPKNTNTTEYFEKRITWLPKYKSHYLEGSFYIINLHSQRIAMRGLKHSDMLVYNQIFIDQEYRITLELLKNINSSCFRIIDAGANVGYTSLYFALNLNSEIVAIEPSRGNIEVLNKNIEINELSEKIMLKNTALSISSKNRYKIDNNFRDGLDWSATTLLDPFGEISSVTVNELLIEKKWETIDLLKMDIEGAEAEIFRSNIDFLEKTRIIAIEVHEEFIPHIEIESLLKRFGFIVFYSGELTIGINKSLME